MFSRVVRCCAVRCGAVRCGAVQSVSSSQWPKAAGCTAPLQVVAFLCIKHVDRSQMITRVVALCALMASVLCAPTAPSSDHFARPCRETNEIEQPTAAAANLGEQISPEEYMKYRRYIINREKDLYPGSALRLSTKEQLVNNTLMKMKTSEVLNPPKDGFPPSRNFISARSDIEASGVFDFLRSFPKGSVLHGHDLGMVSIDWVISNVTYRPHLFVRSVKPGGRINNAPIEFRFMPNRPVKEAEDVPNQPDDDWRLVSDIRARSGNVKAFDLWLRQQMTLEAYDFKDRYTTIDAVWPSFERCFEILTGLLTYRPVFVDYYRRTLQELLDDNTQYLELRSILPSLYDENGKGSGPADVVQIYSDVTAEFVRANKGRFFGARLIYAPWRFVSPAVVAEYAKTLAQLQTRFADFIAGFDLVGQEDKGRPLRDFVPQLLAMSSTTRFFFHAGETSNYGWTDENLVDAVLLNTSRIGHGVALSRHPLLITEMIGRDIAVEVNPVSNQVLQLVHDLRLHPINSLLARPTVPVVVSCDDPGIWGARGVSYDWYELFMGMVPLHVDLRFLKQLVANSIRYSALKEEEKVSLFDIWSKQYDDFINRRSSPDWNLTPNAV